MSDPNSIIDILKSKILLLDGGFGTMIQRYGFNESDFRGREFINHPLSILGFNDILNLTKPGFIKEIHKKYLEAGSDIITTNTFNSNSISLRDYNLDKNNVFVERLNREGVILAREAIEEFEKKNPGIIHFVAGSIGPTNRSSSLSPDVTSPDKRSITYDELFEAYYHQIKGLIDGGVDLLLFETCFDTLNLKAGLDAANSIIDSINIKLPIMVSATVSDRSGRILSGQTLSAFAVTIDEYDNILSLGLNCGFGPEELRKYLKEISENSRHFISCHPNAGLPDINGCYNVGPNDFRKGIESILEDSMVNIIGGCCGTTPEHIKELKTIINNYIPYKPVALSNSLRLAGLEPLIISDKNDFIIVGERCNVAGSKKFLRLINEHNYSEAIEIASKQVTEGARILDINMDDPLLDAVEEMKKFIRFISSEPDIAKVPFMIDSSSWDVIETALKNIQGKGIVNSLSLKEGEEIFIEKAKRVKELGFSLIVMAFDEKGQADTFERKIEICKRAYELLIHKCGFRPSDIIFDVNVMAIATGIESHRKYALDFIRAVEWIKKNLPGAKTSGGISNLSFAFRGKNRLREMMHTVFLYHARNAGLDMAIINPASDFDYENIDIEIRNILEDVILDQNPESEAALLAYALNDKEIKKEIKNPINKEQEEGKSIEERLRNDMIKGNLSELNSHLDEAIKKYNNPIQIIEGPLLEGMKIVGSLFGEGKMFLPQVVKTARVMKEAVDYLSPYFEDYSNSRETKYGKILIATVKGDVHDIGKNIVATVLSCNNYEVVDLGVMVPTEDIISAIEREKPDIVALSGLITPSLSEMGNVAKAMEKEGYKIPLLVGGATTNKTHTAVKLSPLYSGGVIQISDASQNPLVVSKLLNPATREEFLKDLERDYLRIRKKFINDNVETIPYQEAILRSQKNDLCSFMTPKPKLKPGEFIINNLPLKEIIPLINWKMFFLAWDIHGEVIKTFPYSLKEEDIRKWKDSITPGLKEKSEIALSLYKDAVNILNGPEFLNLFDGKAAVAFEEVKSDGVNLILSSKKLPMLRQQDSTTEMRSLVDFIESKDRKKDYIGFFAVTAGKYISDQIEDAKKNNDQYKLLLYQSLGDRLAEAGSEWWHSKSISQYWNSNGEETDKQSKEAIIKTNGIRPAWGYPIMPDQTMILETQDFLPYKELGISLTENGAMHPASSVSGIYILNPQAKYFMIGKIGEDQLEFYSNERNISKERIKEILRI